MSLAVLGSAQAAGPYDGNWTGSANGTTTASGRSGICTATITATVENNVVKGALAFPRTTTPFAGTIASDGTFKMPSGWITGKFVGSSFEGGFSITGGYCNGYRMTMSRS